MDQYERKLRCNLTLTRICLVMSICNVLLVGVDQNVCLPMNVAMKNSSVPLDIAFQNVLMIKIA